MAKSILIRTIIFAMALLAFSCGKKTLQVIEIKHFPMNSLDEVITLSNVEIDKAVTSDSNGSLKIIAPDTTVVKLFEISDINIDNARLIYQAKIRCENLAGYAYLEMWCHFPVRGDFFSRGLQNAVTGTTNWITAEAPFFLQKGEKPDIIKLNFVVAGKGTAWIDDIHLLKAPLQ
jgi:hypothetical protein